MSTTREGKCLEIGLLVLAVCCTGLAFAQAAPVDRFDPVESTPQLLWIVPVVDIIANEEDGVYLHHLDNGDVFTCIDLIVQQYASLVEELDPQVPLNQQSDYPVEHSGHPWPYWAKYTALGAAAEKFGVEAVIVPEYRAVLEDIRDAFLPYLEPMLNER